MSDTVYIKLPQCIEVNHSDVYLGQLGEIWCADKTTAAKCRAIKILSVTQKKNTIMCFLLLRL